MKRTSRLGTSEQFQTACRLRTKLMAMLASVKSLGRRRYAGSISVFSVVNNSCLSVFVAKIRLNLCNPRFKMFNQKRVIMQNKPNFTKNEASVSYDISNGYENAPRFLAQKSQTQFQKRQNEPNSLYINALRTTRYALRTKKQTQNEPKRTQFLTLFRKVNKVVIRWQVMTSAQTIHYTIRHTHYALRNYSPRCRIRPYLRSTTRSAFLAGRSSFPSRRVSDAAGN